MVSAQRTRRKILAALVAGSVAMGCGSDSTNSSGDGGNGGGSMDSGVGGNDALKLTFSPMYSAFGGSHTFKLPVKVDGASSLKGLTVTTTPPGFVDSDPTTDGVMLTMRMAGKATVHIKDSAGNTGSAELNVSAATDELYNTGKDRYNNGIGAFNVDAATLPAFDGSIPGFDGGFDLDGGFNFDGGFPGFDGGAPRLPDGGSIRNSDSACASCHVSGGAGGMPVMLSDGGMAQVDIEHTPQQTGGYSDDDLVNIFTKGMKPAGAPFRVLSQIPLINIIPGGVEGLYMRLHQWKMTDDEQKGIIIYLRGLEPKAQGSVDFGGLLPIGRRGAGGGTTPTPASDASTPGSDASSSSSSSDAGTKADSGADAGT